MKNIDKSDQSINEMNFTDTLVLLWKNKIIIILITFFCALGSLIYSYNVKKLYEVYCIIKPAEPSDETSLSGFSTSSLGLSFGNQESETSEEITQTLKSRDFSIQIYHKYKNNPYLFGDKLLKIDKQEIDSLQKEEKKIETALSLLKDKLFVLADPETGLLKISVRLENKYFAKHFINDLLIILKDKIRKDNIAILNEDIRFYQNQAQNSNNIFIADELKKMVMNKVNRHYLLTSNMFSVKDHPFIPYKNFYPKKLMILLIYSSIGFIISSGIVIIRHKYKK